MRNEESGLGDHMIFLPGGDLDHQVMFMNLSGSDFDPPEFSEGIGLAALLNP